MKSFFIIKKESNLNIIGNYDQTEFDPLEEDNRLIYKDNWINLLNQESKFGLRLKKQGIVTDFLINSPLIGPDILCFNTRINELFEKYEIDESLKAKVILRDNLNSYNYHFLKFPNKRLEYINWQKSRFAKTNWSIFEEEITISNETEYNTIQNSKQMQNIHVISLSLNDSVISQDVFFIGLPVFGIIVSDSLKEHLELQDVTGITFEPIHNFTNVTY